MAIEFLESFAPAVGDWVAVYQWTEAPAAVDPWVLEPIIGWAIVETPTAEIDAVSSVREILPVIGGDVITMDGDGWLGVYRRADLLQPAIRQQLLAKCGREAQV